MKNLFRFHGSKEGAAQLDSEFVVKRIGSETAAKQKKLREEIEAFEKHTGIPQWLSLAALVMMALGFALFAGPLDSLADDVPYETMVGNGLWWFFGIGLGLFIAGIGIKAVAFFRKKSAMASPVCGDLEERWKRLERESREELLVPGTAIPVDIISEYGTFAFKQELFPRVNSEQYVFCDGPAVCLASISCVVKIPYERIERIERVERGITFPNWNKEQDISADVIKRYKVKVQNGQYRVKPYYRIVLRANEPCAILFPSYEYERLSPLLGSSATDYVTVKK